MMSRAPGLFALLLLSLAGCSWSAETVEETDDIPIPDGHKDEECGETAPVVEAVYVQDGGMHDFEGTMLPTIRISADTVDEDGDLHYYEMHVWWDLVVDGHVEPEGVPMDVYGTLSDTECSVDDVTLSMIMGLRGGDPPYSTEVEFGVRILDDLENESNDGALATASYVLPDANGDYPE